MTSKETISYLNDLRIKNNVSFAEIEETIAQNENKIAKIAECIEKNDSYSNEVMKRTFKLLNDSAEEVITYYNQSCMSNVDYADTFWKDEHSAVAFVISSFFHNPVFFTKAWNLNAIINWKLSTASIPDPAPTPKPLPIPPQSEEVDYYIYATAAGTPGFNNLTKMPINFPFLGELEVRGNSETERLVFVLFIAPECREMKFKMNIYYEIDNKEYTATIIKDSPDSKEQISTPPIRIDFSKGIHIKKVEWKPL